MLQIQLQRLIQESINSSISLIISSIILPVAAHEVLGLAVALMLREGIYTIVAHIQSGLYVQDPHASRIGRLPPQERVPATLSIPIATEFSGTDLRPLK